MQNTCGAEARGSVRRANWALHLALMRTRSLRRDVGRNAQRSVADNRARAVLDSEDPANVRDGLPCNVAVGQLVLEQAERRRRTATPAAAAR